MRILFLSHYFFPHIGGVEKHVLFLSKELVKKGHSVTILTEKFDPKLKSTVTVNGIKIIRFDYPRRKFAGLFFIWLFIWGKRSLFMKSEVIHIHDVFVWYLPFKFLFPNKKIYTTIHGYEPENPFSWFSVFQKKVAIKLSSGTIGVGKFLEKYMGVKFDAIIYGGTNIPKEEKKEKNKIVFIGRLSKDTGVLKFLEFLKINKKFKAVFVGDGELRNKCEKYGKVYGFVDPEKFLRKAEYAVPGGYLSLLEAIAGRCKIKVFWDSKLKKDYWQMSPMYKFILNGDLNSAFLWVKSKSWKKLAEDYVKLWG